MSIEVGWDSNGRYMSPLGEVHSAPRRLDHPSGVPVLEYVPYLLLFPVVPVCAALIPAACALTDATYHDDHDGRKFATITDAVGTYTWELLDAHSRKGPIYLGRRVSAQEAGRD